MSKKAIILFIAEIAAVAVLRLAYMVRRDRLLMPRSSKVNHIKRKPVYKNRKMPTRGSTLEDKVRDHEIEGYTPKYVDGKIQLTPDESPDAQH
jgi:hypothetical protein